MIDEGDLVTTLDGTYGTVEEIYDHHNPYLVQVVVNGGTYQKKNCVKLKEPLRIRVNSEQEARFVVEYAEDAGWEPFVESVDELKPAVWDDEMCLHLALKDRKLIDLDPCQPYNTILDFGSDYDQWTAWVDYWSEN